MRRLFVGNFDFEHRLGRAAGNKLPESVERINQELAAVWVAVAAGGDFLWLPAPVEESFFEQLAAHGLPALQPVDDERSLSTAVELCPWGWTETLRRWADKNCWSYSAPKQAIIRRVNSRRFSFDLEREWGLAICGAAEVGSADELTKVLGQLPPGCQRWAIKAEFGMSARERILGRGQEPNEATLNWVRKRIKTDGRVFFEPWIDGIDEAGIQFTIPRTGPVVLEGITPLLTGPNGEYRGSRFAADPHVEESWSPAVEVGLRAAERMQHLGYFGPLGIDAVHFRDREGSVFLRPLQDVNARYTMGRLSLGFRRLLHPGETGSWLHVPWPSDSRESAREWFAEFQSKLPEGARAVRTSPFRVDDRPTAHGTLVVISQSPAHLDEIEQRFSRGLGECVRTVDRHRP